MNSFHISHPAANTTFQAAKLSEPVPNLASVFKISTFRAKKRLVFEAYLLGMPRKAGGFAAEKSNFGAGMEIRNRLSELVDVPTGMPPSSSSFSLRNSAFSLRMEI